MKAVVGLGNPGPEYDDTRHNVGWWALDRLAYDWDVGAFRRDGKALVAEGSVNGQGVLLLKPRTYMNRSGQALTALRHLDEFDVHRDLLILVDDANLEVGRLRLRPGGGTGGHNGLESVAGALGTEEYARLRIGVGRPPDGVTLHDWVLSAMSPDDEEAVVDVLPRVTRAVEAWIDQGIEAAMNRFNG